MPEENFGKILLETFSDFLYFCFLYDIVLIWIVKFGEPPVIHQIHQGFPVPHFYVIQYDCLSNWKPSNVFLRQNCTIYISIYNIAYSDMM